MSTRARWWYWLAIFSSCCLVFCLVPSFCLVFWLVTFSKAWPEVTSQVTSQNVIRVIAKVRRFTNFGVWLCAFLSSVKWWNWKVALNALIHLSILPGSYETVSLTSFQSWTRSFFAYICCCCLPLEWIRFCLIIFRSMCSCEEKDALSAFRK